jgi:hypothetical protein
MNTGTGGWAFLEKSGFQGQDDLLEMEYGIVLFFIILSNILRMDEQPCKLGITTWTNKYCSATQQWNDDQ